MRVSSLRTALLLLLSTQFLAADPATAPTLSERQKAQHVLDRLGFGARPGDVERVLALGVARYVDQQLHPEQIDDRRVEASLSRYGTLAMTSSEIGRQFYRPMIEARRNRKRQEAADPSSTSNEEAKKRDRLPPQQQARRLVGELVASRIVRATDSERQLNEVMVDFWLNHFNVYAGKGIDRFLLTSYERDTVRPHVWGKFEDLLLATAKSPAMLFYLDNARSVADPEHRAMSARDPRMIAAKGKKQGGLNENYAREIMELHTLGVDGGYTQKDVTELARALTGWSISRPGEGSGATFVFRAAAHDRGAKNVLGVRLPAGGGMEEGERMIRFLAHQPATAHHIAYQLCQRLVADEPPSTLVDKVAKRFLESGGDLRQTVAAVVTSNEFFDSKYFRAKTKSPFEYVVSALRAVGAEVHEPLAVARSLREMGEGLYEAQPPTGYSDLAATWVNSGALLNRLNFAIALTSSRVPGTAVDLNALLSAKGNDAPSALVDHLAAVLTGGALSEQTRTTIRQRNGAGDDVPAVAALILGSPEFQKQ